jgi:hypothetical protein
MSISSKILPAVTLVVALSPLAAQARSNPQPNPAQYDPAPLNHQNQVMTGSATIDDPTTFYSGGPAPMFRMQPGPVQYDLARLNHQNQVMTDSATIDNSTATYSGGLAPMFPITR